jgi:hypothetical protein
MHLAHACSVRVEYFFRTHQIELFNISFQEFGILNQRAQVHMKYKIIGFIERRIELLRFTLETTNNKFSESNEIFDQIQSLNDLKQFAENHCKRIPLGTNPINFLNGLLEELGILFIVVNEYSSNFKMLTATAKSLEGMYYHILAVSSEHLESLIATICPTPSDENIQPSKNDLGLFEGLVVESLRDGLISESKAAELLDIPLMCFYESNKGTIRKD